MALQNFVDFIGPVFSAAWANGVDILKYTIFGDATTKAGARTALTSDAPLEVANGGTSRRTLADFAGDLAPLLPITGDTLPTQTGKARQVLQTDGTDPLWMPKDAVYVNDFYPTGVVPKVDVCNGTSHPLSGFFADLAAAQAFYPHATSLTDEVDWAAWQAASDYVRTSSPDYGPTYNFSSGRIKADGRYLINRSVQFSHEYILIEGKVNGPRFPRGGNTSVSYNGTAGTDTNKIALFDFYPVDETDVAPPGILKSFSGGTFKCSGMTFYGLGDATASPTTAPSTTGYCWGIRLRNGSFCEISNCAFGGGLLDGIVACSQLFLKIHDCFFYGVNRDCISILGFLADFSTTVWIEDNEFGYFGRYAILQNYNGAIEPFPSIRRNSVEGGSSSSYYYNHPEHFVMGLCSAFCQIGGTYGEYAENRFEAMTTQIPQLWADVFFISCAYVKLLNNRMGGQAFSTYREDPNRVTADYTTFVNTYKYVDITNTRNFHAPTSTDYKGSGSCGNFEISLMTGLTLDIEGVGISNGFKFEIRDSTIFPITVHVDTSGYYYRVKAPGVDIPVLRAANVPAVVTNCYLTGWPSFGPVRAIHLDSLRGIGTYSTTTEHGFGTWTAGSTYIAEYYPYIYAQYAKKWVKPLTYNGYAYQCIVSGTSGGSEPTWPTTLGATVVDGTVTWQCMSPLKLTGGYVDAESIQYYKRTILGDAAPTSINGRLDVGDVVRNRNPSDGSPTGWICTTAGIPGTWKVMGWVADTAPSTVALTDTTTVVQSGTTAKKSTIQKLMDAIFGATDGTVVLPKATGTGIKVDRTTPTWAWKDLLGSINTRTGGATAPSFAAYRNNLYQFSFGTAAGVVEVFNEYHVPHDYVPGTDMHIHAHWSNAIAATGNANWLFEVIYAKGYDQDNFTGLTGGSGSVIVSVAQAAGATAFKHEIAEVQLSCGDLGRLNPNAALVSITTGTPDLTADIPTWTEADVGRTVVVLGAGPTSGDLGTTISAFVSTTAVTLANNASTTVTAQNSFRYRLLDSARLEVDGMLLVRTYRDSSRGADTLDQAPFLHMVDIHYQSTNVGTKQKNGPAFYT